MRPVTIAEVRAIQRLIRQGKTNKVIAHQSGRSAGLVARVRRGIVTGKSLKIHAFDRVDIHHWWKQLRALPTMAQMARKYKVTHQYIRNICYEMDKEESCQSGSNAKATRSILVTTAQEQL